MITKVQVMGGHGRIMTNVQVAVWLRPGLQSRIPATGCGLGCHRLSVFDRLPKPGPTGCLLLDESV